MHKKFLTSLNNALVPKTDLDDAQWARESVGSNLIEDPPEASASWSDPRTGETEGPRSEAKGPVPPPTTRTGETGGAALRTVGVEDQDRPARLWPSDQTCCCRLRMARRLGWASGSHPVRGFRLAQPGGQPWSQRQDGAFGRGSAKGTRRFLAERLLVRLARGGLLGSSLPATVTPASAGALSEGWMRVGSGASGGCSDSPGSPDWRCRPAETSKARKGFRP